MHSKLVAVVSVMLAVSACQVSQETKPAEVQLDGDLARSQVSALSTAVTSAESDDGLAIAEALAEIGDDAVALVPEAKGGAKKRWRRASTSCGCKGSAQSCTFDHCTIGNATVSGTLSWKAGEIRCTGLTFDIAEPTLGSAHVAVDCSLSHAPGKLGGKLHTTGNAVVEGVTYTWDATIAANAVTFTSRSFTGGSVDVSAAVSMSSADEADRSFQASAVLTLP